MFKWQLCFEGIRQGLACLRAQYVSFFPCRSAVVSFLFSLNFPLFNTMYVFYLLGREGSVLEAQGHSCPAARGDLGSPSRN